MVKVKRGGVVLRVEKEDLAHYLNMGFDEVDTRGVVLTRGTPSSEADLRRAYNAATARIAELEAELEALKAKSTKRTKKTTDEE